MLRLLRLGDLSSKYEVGTGGPGFVSSGKGDPGGISYGSYQLASKPGTVEEFLKNTNYYNGELAGMSINSQRFIDKWRELGNTDATNFELAQWQFIKDTHYDPVREYADKLNILNNPAIDQVLWSMSVQHGQAKQIVHDALVSGEKDPKVVIHKLYAQRRKYIKNIGLSKTLIASLNNRYANEENDAIALASQV